MFEEHNFEVLRRRGRSVSAMALVQSRTCELPINGKLRRNGDSFVLSTARAAISNCAVKNAIDIHMRPQGRRCEQSSEEVLYRSEHRN